MPFIGVPTFLEAQILQARKGGARSYEEVGYQFGIHNKEMSGGGTSRRETEQIQLRIFGELPILPEDELMRELRDFLTM